jgi:hypothetical protein
MHDADPKITIQEIVCSLVAATIIGVILIWLGWA